MGFLPTYQQAGGLSTALLVICRLLQGFSGEFGLAKLSLDVVGLQLIRLHFRLDSQLAASYLRQWSIRSN